MHFVSLSEDLRRCLDGAAPANPELGSPARPASHVATQVAAATDCELVHLGRLVGLEVPRTLTLVLKRQWEGFLAARSADEPEGRHGGRTAGPHPHARVSRDFHPGVGGAADAEELFRLFEEEDRYAGREGYDRETFQTLCHQCVLLNLHLLSIHGPEMEAFVASQQAERALLRDASPAEREAYWLKHCRWREREDEVSSLLLDVEEQALANRRVQQEWLETFGAVYLPLLEAEARFASLERTIRRKEEEPALTLQELEDLESEHLRQEQEQTARMKQRLARAKAVSPSGTGGIPLEDAELLEYEADTKRLLRDIYRLTHPDAIGLQRFTESQRERLTALYREALALANPSAIGDEEVSRGMRSAESLEALLAAARKIWECMGLDVNESALLRGDTLAERLAWLETRIAELEEEAGRVRSDLLAVATDPDVREKRSSMASRELIARVTEELEGRRVCYEGQIPELEARLRSLFGGAVGE